MTPEELKSLRLYSTTVLFLLGNYWTRRRSPLIGDYWIWEFVPRAPSLPGAGNGTTRSRSENPTTRRTIKWSATVYFSGQALRGGFSECVEIIQYSVLPVRASSELFLLRSRQSLAQNLHRRFTQQSKDTWRDARCYSFYITMVELPQFFYGGSLQKANSARHSFKRDYKLGTSTVETGTVKISLVFPDDSLRTLV